jgi:hypothetical protein
MTFGISLFWVALMGLAAAIPVVLHMINRQKAKELPFSTLRFLRVSLQKTRRRKRIHDVLLMLIRAAVLLLIALGLAKPTLTNLSSLWGGARTAVVVILDNSASMGMIDQGQVRFRTALHAAEQIMDELREGDQVALLLTGGPTPAEEGKLYSTQEKVRQILAQWVNAPSKTSGVSYERADLAGKLQQARSLLAKSDATNKQIYILSDLQKLSWENSGTSGRSAAAGTPEAGNRLATTGTAATPEAEESIPVIFVDCHRAPKPNVAVGDVSLSTAVPVAGLPIRATVELLNASAVLQQPRLELYIDGNKEETSPELNLPPGARLTHDFTFTPTRSGLHRGEVRLAGDDGSKLDDRRFFVVEVDQGIPVAVVKPQRHEIPYLEDTFYVERALAPGKSGDWAIRTTALVAGDLLGASQLSEPLSQYKVIYCVNLPAPPSETAERLRAYVAGGGNLVWICGDNVDPAAYNQMDRQAGGGLLPAPLVDVRSADREEGRDSWQVSFLDREHPALSHLAEPAVLYESVLVYKHVRIDVQDGTGVWVMARLDDGQPLLLQRNVEEGKVLLLGTSAHVDWSNLPLRPIFLPLLVRLTFDLAGVKQLQHTLLAGSPLELPLEGATRPTGVEILSPGGEMIRRTTQNEQGEPLSTFRYDDTHEIGVYEFRLLGRDSALWEATPSATEGPSTIRSPTESPPTAGGARQIGYAVNVDPDEADPAKIEREELEKLLAPAALVFAENPDDLSGTFKQLREGKSLWGLFLTGVLLALVFETLLANRLTPKQEETSAEQPPPGMRRLAAKGRGAV